MAGFVFWLCVFLIVYVYFGYPLLITLVARFYRPSHYPPFLPSVTLLIAAYNEEDVIASKLENSLSLDYPRDFLQIIVAADGSDDQTVQIVKKYKERGVELSFLPQRRGKMAAINHAMELARHEIVVFSDANNHYLSDSLREIVKPFSDEDVGAVSGDKTVMSSGGNLGQADGLYWRYESFIKRQESLMGSCVGSSGEIFAIRRRLFDSPPSMIINDDFYMMLSVLKKGCKVVYANTARSIEAMTLSEQDEVIRRTRIFAGHFQAMFQGWHMLPFRRPLVIWQVYSHKYLRGFVPLGMIGAFFANAIAVGFSHRGLPEWFFLGYPYNIIFMVLQVLFYFTAWLGMQIEPQGPIAKILYVPTFLLNSNYAALRGLIRYLNRKQTAVWTKVAR